MLYSANPVAVAHSQNARTAQFSYQRARWGRFDKGTLSQSAARARTHLPVASTHLQRTHEVLGPELTLPQQEYLRAWRLALHNSGGAIEAADDTHYQKTAFTLLARTYPAVSMQLASGTRRRSIADNTNDRCPCRLCASLQEALNRPGAASGMLAQLGDYVLLVNKYPANIGDALLLPIRHDAPETRCTLQRDAQGKVFASPRHGSTREALLTEEYILSVMGVCDRFGLNARRSHLLDGKSEPHDHFKLVPTTCPQDCINSILPQERASRSDEVEYFLPEGTPFDSLGLRAAKPRLLAQALVRLTRALELRNQVYTLVYAQGCWLLTPRWHELLADYCETPAFGAALGAHGLPDPERSPALYARALQLVPHKGSGYWQRYAFLLGQESLRLREAA